MTSPREFLRPRVRRHISSAAPARTDQHVASYLVVQAARRLEIVSTLAFAALLLLWLLVHLIQGDLADEFGALHEWAPPIAALAASAAMLLIARSRRWSSSTLVRIGLVYEVVISIAITCAYYLGAFEGMAASDVTVDRIGFSAVAPWTLFYTVLVPARPREALIALIASAGVVPVVYLAQVSIGAAPALAVSQFLPIFVFPYVVSTCSLVCSGACRPPTGRGGPARTGGRQLSPGRPAWTWRHGRSVASVASHARTSRCNQADSS